MNKTVAATLVLVMGMSALAVFVPSASAEPYENTTWVGDLAVPRAGAATAVGMDDRIYAFGGFQDTGWALAMSSVVIFDPETGETTYGSPMPVGAAVASVVRVANGSFLLIGGYNGSAGVLQSLQIYNPTSDSWSDGPLMPFGLYWSAVCVGQDSRVYVFGGRLVGNSTQIFDPVANSWSFGADLTTPRFGASAVLTPSGDIMLIGGADVFQPYDLVDIYDPVADSWSSGVNLELPRAHGGALLARNGHVYYFGGQNIWFINSAPAEIYPDFERFELSAGTAWEREWGYMLASFGFCVDSYGRAFIVGGWDGTNIRVSVYMWLLSDIGNPYQVMITTPSDGGVVSDMVTVQAEIVNWMGSGDPWNAFMGADFLVDGTLYESQTSGWAWSFKWNTTGLLDGSVHTLTVRGYHWDGKIVEDSVTVTVWAESATDKLLQIVSDIASLQAEIASLQGMIDEVNGSVADVQAQIAVLQAQLTGLGLALVALQEGLVAMGEGQAAAMDDLNETLADLQLQLDAFQEQIDRVESKADDGGILGMVTLVLVIVVIVLSALMLVMARKKPLPPPPQ